jgi:hypothetical protein
LSDLDCQVAGFVGEAHATDLVYPKCSLNKTRVD